MLAQFLDWELEEMEGVKLFPQEVAVRTVRHSPHCTGRSAPLLISPALFGEDMHPIKTGLGCQDRQNGVQTQGNCLWLRTRFS